MIQIIHKHMHTHTPIARVIIPPETVILKEGSFVNPAEIFLNLSARSYGFSVSIGIDTMLPTSVNFAEGKLQAVSENSMYMYKYIYLFDRCTCSPVEH